MRTSAQICCVIVWILFIMIALGATGYTIVGLRHMRHHLAVRDEVRQMSFQSDTVAQSLRLTTLKYMAQRKDMRFMLTFTLYIVVLFMIITSCAEHTWLDRSKCSQVLGSRVDSSKMLRWNDALLLLVALVCLLVFAWALVRGLTHRTDVQMVLNASYVSTGDIESLRDDAYKCINCVLLVGGACAVVLYTALSHFAFHLILLKNLTLNNTRETIDSN